MAALKLQVPVRRYERIHPGMTVEEVDAVLGVKSGSWQPGRGRAGRIYPPVGWYLIEVTFEGGQVRSKKITFNPPKLPWRVKAATAPATKPVPVPVSPPPANGPK
jgi:hypothetical protein